MNVFIAIDVIMQFDVLTKNNGILYSAKHISALIPVSDTVELIFKELATIATATIRNILGVAIFNQLEFGCNTM